eukprot:2983338-Lingulodinium_polyedra.AAC.1
MAGVSSPSLPWRSLSMEQVVAGIRDLTPTEIQAGWKRLRQDNRLREVGVEEEQAALWVETNGAQH